VYAVAGEGLPVVFLHGWALGHRSYRQSLGRLVELGCQVLAPALPGFGGTADLPSRRFSLAGYADWVAAFLDAVEVDEPVFLLGHSFGGGVAIKTAYVHGDRVRTLVLVNSIGGAAWQVGERSRALAQRPLWDWGIQFSGDIWPIPQAARVLPAVLEELVPNVVRNPRAIWRVAGLARRADLRRELDELKRRELPVVVLSSARDGVIPRAAFDALCAALGSEGHVVEGSHSWLLADPDHFGELMTNHIEVAKLARQLPGRGKSRTPDADVAAAARDARRVEPVQ
jgi:pimeloyl-ACP methyl ester carboxylesterase